MRLSLAEAERLCFDAAVEAGAGEAAAASLARATVAAEAAGQANVGVAHLLDYLDALRQGRIAGHAEPSIVRPAATIFLSDAKEGIAQLGFDLVFPDLVHAARELGVAIFSQRNAYTAGSLGWFAGRLADEGLVALAATNGPALLAGSSTVRPVFCTNPLAFAAPVDGGPPLLIDQASSATAFVNIREAARRGESIPPGWALDAEGNETTDPVKAMSGALLAFGGARGANIALMVEVLAAGLSGANWSLDAPSFSEGDRSPGSGLSVVALSPILFDLEFGARLAAHLDRLSREFGLHVPGPRKAAMASDAMANGVEIDDGLLAKLTVAGSRSPQ